MYCKGVNYIMNRCRNTCIRLTEAMYQDIKKLADLDERSVSSFVRLTLARVIAEHHEEMEDK